jgi:AAHS family 4-hydroxybenzoate transporter-like MFS transporter
MRRLLCVALGLLILMIDGYDLQSVGFVASDVAKGWSVELAAFGKVFAAALAGTIPGAMLAGSLARMIGKRAALASALLIFGMGSVATAYTTDLLQLAALRFVLGWGLGASVPLVLSLVAENTPERFRATLATIALCGQPLGAVVGAALCARLIPHGGWPAVFQVGGVLPLLLIPAVGIFREPRARVPVVQALSEPQRRTEMQGDRLMDLFHGDLLLTTVLLCAGTFLAATLVYVMANWLPGVARAQGYSLQRSLLAIGLFNFGGIAGAIAQGVLTDRFGSMRTTVPAFAVSAFAICLLPAAHAWPPMLFVAALLAGFAGYGATISLGPLALLTYPPALRTSGVGWVLGIGRLGGVASPLIVGWMLAAGMPSGSSFYLAAAAAALAAACLASLFSLRARRADAGGDEASHAVS